MTTLPRPLSSLPEELLTSILSYLPTRDLLGVSSTSHRVHDTVYYLVEQRFRHVDKLDGFSLIFECFAPAAKMDTPYYQCTYNGTSIAPNQPLAETYSHFTPIPPPARTHSPTPATSVTTQVHLEDSEYFSQRCCSSILAKPGPRRGLFTEVLPLHSESILRIKRSWLVEAALEGRSKTLWIDDEKKDIGVIVKVQIAEVPENQRTSYRGQFRGGIAGGDEDEEVMFNLEYQELLVRTGALVGAMELKNNGGKTTAPEGMFGMQPYYCWPWIQQGPALVVF